MMTVMMMKVTVTMMIMSRMMMMMHAMRSFSEDPIIQRHGSKVLSSGVFSYPWPDDHARGSVIVVVTDVVFSMYPQTEERRGTTSDTSGSVSLLPTQLCRRVLHPLPLLLPALKVNG